MGAIEIDKTQNDHGHRKCDDGPSLESVFSRLHYYGDKFNTPLRVTVGTHTYIIWGLTCVKSSPQGPLLVGMMEPVSLWLIPWMSVGK